MGTAAGGLGGVRREWICARRAILFSSLPVCFYCYHGFYRKESTPSREPTRAAGEPTPRMHLGPHRRLESSMESYGHLTSISLFMSTHCSRPPLVAEINHRLCTRVSPDL